MTTTTAPKLELFSLRTSLLSEGNTHTLLGKTGSFRLDIKVYATGGENGLHAHPNEDHAFVVLDGQATFHDRDGKPIVVNKYQGALVPKGAYYRFHNTGGSCLVMLRIGGATSQGEAMKRIGITGKPTELGSKENLTGSIPGVPIPGKFFGA